VTKFKVEGFTESHTFFYETCSWQQLV